MQRCSLWVFSNVVTLRNAKAGHTIQISLDALSLTTSIDLLQKMKIKHVEKFQMYKYSCKKVV